MPECDEEFANATKRLHKLGREDQPSFSQFVELCLNPYYEISLRTKNVLEKLDLINNNGIIRNDQLREFIVDVCGRKEADAQASDGSLRIHSVQ